MTDIFVNYRREDTKLQADRLTENLEARFGKKHVFQDVGTLRAGTEWRREVEQAVASAHVLLALIGREWLNVRDSSGRARLQKPDDAVRIEIEKALVSEDTCVVPVLVDGAAMPTAPALPESLQRLRDRHAVSLRTESWRQDVESLVKEVERVVEEAHRPAKRIARLRERIDEPAYQTRVYESSNVELKELAAILVSYFRADGMEVQPTGENADRISLQARHAGKGRKWTGLSSALTVLLEREEESLRVTIGASKWSKRAVGLGARRAGAAFLSPPVGASLMIAALYGTWKQTKLPSKTFEIIEQYLSDHRTSVANA